MIPTFKVKRDLPFTYPDGTPGVYLIFTCPKCKAVNSHGGFRGKPGSADGHRSSHCRCWPSGYFLVEIKPQAKLETKNPVTGLQVAGSQAPSVTAGF